MNTARFSKKRQKGQGLMELAVSLLILVILLTGVLELGRLLYTYIAMRDAAQEGAVYAAIFPSACDQIIERVRGSLWDSSANTVTVSIVDEGGTSYACGTQPSIACAPQKITGGNLQIHSVNITVRQEHYPIDVPFFATVVGKPDIDLTATMTGNIIRPPCP